MNPTSTNVAQAIPGRGQQQAGGDQFGRARASGRGLDRMVVVVAVIVMGMVVMGVRRMGTGAM